ncbi:potassium-transporting ATPase subunit KdpC [Leptospira licerasiae]|uniref:Potassium-transporting ATPase KdpC subunit n=1 Tax=Leptospira licerasiae str. MMD4847 TaxID=1049971 RepID=A0ABP2RFR3_9LEPT|nr:potassium-transporting ATPase subunit KdpC [Leptospira licerasiae]EIE01334.1 K+-transporting ATPase, C subunit [Leptospira licerasiae serovar Varillal str. VAR 010]EJZ43351.1 K+-transporting ATPase, C subunit [Leptospira licerasiae str. MMD4847]
MIRAVLQFGFWTFICGIFYPALVYGFAKFVFPKESSGSLIELDGKVIGSELLAQSFESPEYFHPRPSAIGYDTSSSGASNLGPTSIQLTKKAEERRKYWVNRGGSDTVPSELLYSSGSGLDPHLSIEAVKYQVPLVAKTRGISEEKLTRLVEESVESPELGLFGPSKINILKLNLKLRSVYSEENILKK